MSYYKIHDLENYFKMYKNRYVNLENFGIVLPMKILHGIKKWDKVLNLICKKPNSNGFKCKSKHNKNCIDRHLAKRGDKTAIIFEPNDPSEAAQHITYNELYARVSKLANVLRDQGIKKEIEFVFTPPMIPELVVAVLACARIGAIHSVVLLVFCFSSCGSY